MFKTLLQLEWKSFFRSASLGKNLALKVLMWFVAIYFLCCSLILGIATYPLLEESFPDQEPLKIVNQFILYWLLMELAMRFFLQTLPVLNIRPFLVNNIKRDTVINFVLIKSIFSVFNLLTPIFVIPFGIFLIYKNDLSIIQSLGWMLSIISLILCVNFMNFLLKKKFSDNIKGLLPYLIIAIALGTLEYFKVFSISSYFGTALDVLSVNWWLSTLPIIAAILLYKWNFNYLKNNFYLDSGLQQKKQTIDNRDLSWTKKFGSIAPFLQLDLRLILRNKRPKSTLYMSFIFATYGLLIYNFDTYNNPMMFVFVGIFMTGIFVINFGQFIPAWDSSYYSMMMSQNIPMKQYLKSKAGLMYFSVIIMTILTLPYMYYGTDVIITNLCCAIYNIGINIPIILFAGSFNKKRIDLEKSPFMNYQGTGSSQWIVSLPLIILPVLIYIPFHYLMSPIYGAVALAIVGILGLSFKNIIFNKIIEGYKKRKHQMIAGYKQEAS